MSEPVVNGMDKTNNIVKEKEKEKENEPATTESQPEQQKHHPNENGIDKTDETDKNLLQPDHKTEPHEDKQQVKENGVVKIDETDTEKLTNKTEIQNDKGNDTQEPQKNETNEMKSENTDKLQEKTEPKQQKEPKQIPLTVELDTIFGQILRRERSAKIVYEDEICMAVEHYEPESPIHLVVFPRKKITQLSKATEADKPILGHLLYVIKKIAPENGLGNGCRVVINEGYNGNQEIFHLHIHVLGGCRGTRTFFT